LAPLPTAPSFTVITDHAWCEVQVATDPLLFSPANAKRRVSGSNFASSGLLPSGAPGPLTWTVPDGRDLVRPPALFYRALAYDPYDPNGPRSQVPRPTDVRLRDPAGNTVVLREATV